MKSIKILILGLLSTLTVAGVSYAQQSDVCSQPWFPNGVNHQQCPDGLEYPTLNAYNDSLFLDANATFKESNFALVRDLDNQNARLSGFKDTITLNDPNKIYEGYFYIHNSGRPDCNFPSGSSQLRQNNCEQSTILNNVNLKLNNTFRTSTNSQGETILVSDGVIDRQNNRRIHVFTANLSSSNGNPRNLSDSFTVYTPIDKSIYLNKTTRNRICTSFRQETVNGVIKDVCQTNSLKTHNELTLNLAGSGLNLTSKYEGSPNTGNTFYASERYIREVMIYLKLTDAPEEQNICEGITVTRSSGTVTSTNQTFRITFDPNEKEFHDNFEAQITGGGQLNFNFVDRFALQDYTNLQLNNLTANSVVTVRSKGSSSACSTRLTFEDIPTIDDSCKELNIVVDPSKTTETSVTFDIVTTPSIYATKARIETTNGTRTPSTPPTQTISNITAKTTITAYVPGEENCRDTLDFTPTPPPPGGEACKAITINTDTYDYQQNPRPTFEVTSKNPSDFEANFIWTVKGQTGNTIEVRQGQDLLSFRPQNQLTGNETVHVEVEDANNPDCQKDISSSKPPVEKICKDLQVVRILNPQLRRTIPNNGQPAIFRLNVGEYEGTITFQSDADPRLTTFLSNKQRTNGKITVKPSDTVIILNRAENATIKVFASDENQYTKDCYLELKADSDDEGDKLTDIDKTVDRSFATNGDILNYTIKYTISPIFGDPNFKDALKGLDRATLKDNINLIYGIQDTLINPLEAVDTRLIPLDLRIPSSLEATGDLFGVEGLVIEDLTEKAGKTYTITYAARLDADIIQECLTITNSCGFEFPNTASDNFGNEDTASVLATCPFVISRSFGDVFLEEEFENTIDISSCTNRRSSDGPVFTPQPQKPRELISSGTGILSAPSHRICQESIKQNPDLPSDLDGYKNPLQNFSSGVCEVSLFTSSNWTSDDIEKSLRSNVSRYANVTNLNTTNQLTDLNQNSLTTFDTLNPNPQNKVYRKTNGSLTITSDSTLIQNDNQAKTIIVEGNDLIINQNVTYGTNQNTLFPSQIAFIVIGGDIVVGPNVTDIQGVLVAVPDANGNGGFIRRSEQTDKLLTLRGSIFGDSGPLFSGTSNPGDLEADKGAVTVIYDSNIILNTPPALQSIVQFNQYQTVR